MSYTVKEQSKRQGVSLPSIAVIPVISVLVAVCGYSRGYDPWNILFSMIVIPLGFYWALCMLWLSIVLIASLIMKNSRKEGDK